MLLVHVGSISGGEQLQLDIEPHRGIAHLKQRIVDIWSVPFECQNLIYGSSILTDRMLLELAEQYNDASVTMLMSLERVLQKLDGIESDQVAALNTLAKLGSRGGNAAIDAIMPCLAARSKQVRCAARKALGAVSERGHDRTIALLTMRLTDESRTVVVAAILLALKEVSERGNERIMGEAIARLQHHSAQVRQAAVELLGVLAPKGDERSMNSMLHCLEDDQAHVRQAALAALKNIAARGHKRTIAIAHDLLVDRNSWDREVQAAVELLLVVADQRDDRIIGLLTAQLESENDMMRQTVLEAIADLGEKGNNVLVSAVIASVKGCHTDILLMRVVEALETVASKGDECVISVLLAILKKAMRQRMHNVTGAAKHALNAVAEVGDVRVASAMNASDECFAWMSRAIIWAIVVAFCAQTVLVGTRWLA